MNDNISKKIYTKIKTHTYIIINDFIIIKRSKTNKKKYMSAIAHDTNHHDGELKLSAEDIFKRGKKDDYELPPIIGGIE